MKDDVLMSSTLQQNGFHPTTLQDVLKKRNKIWAKTQELPSEAFDVQQRLQEAYREQCRGSGLGNEGWVKGEWHPIIYCPDTRPGGEMVFRTKKRTAELYKQLLAAVQGVVHPGILVCEILDPTHPVLFAAPPEQSCYTLLYVGESITESTPRVVFGEYTGTINKNCHTINRFEYVFDLTFCKDAWRFAEDVVDDDSDEELDEQCNGKAKEIKFDTSSDTTKIILPGPRHFVLDSHDAYNEMSLLNHYGIFAPLGPYCSKRNCEWQQVFVDGWPHIVLTSIPGVPIRSGEELHADFGNEWFHKVQAEAMKSMCRELLEWRLGIRVTGEQQVQKLAVNRPIEFIDKEKDPLAKPAELQMCGICLDYDRDTEDTSVHCDTCDRPYHLRCLDEAERLLDDCQWYCMFCVKQAEEICRAKYGTVGGKCCAEDVKKFVKNEDWMPQNAAILVDGDSENTSNNIKKEDTNTYVKLVTNGEVMSTASDSMVPLPLSSPSTTAACSTDGREEFFKENCIDKEGIDEPILKMSPQALKKQSFPYFGRTVSTISPHDMHTVKNGVKTLIPLPPEGLLTDLKVCTSCYKKLGPCASVEVCRLVKRHLEGNWDHPDNTTAQQISNAILICYQTKLAQLQTEISTMNRIPNGASPVENKSDGRRKTTTGHSRMPTGVTKVPVGGINGLTELCQTKGYIPLIGIHLGKTAIRTEFADGWWTGTIVSYHPISRHADMQDTLMSTLFRVLYSDGDAEWMQPEKLIEILMEQALFSSLHDRCTKYSKTSSVYSMLNPELLKWRRLANAEIRLQNEAANKLKESANSQATEYSSSQKGANEKGNEKKRKCTEASKTTI